MTKQNWISRIQVKRSTVYQKWISEKEYVKSFTDRGETVPSFLVFMPYEERDGEPGYLVPCREDDPERESPSHQVYYHYLIDQRSLK